MLGGTALAVPFISKTALAATFLRKSDGSLLNIDDISAGGGGSGTPGGNHGDLQINSSCKSALQGKQVSWGDTCRKAPISNSFFPK